MYPHIIWYTGAPGQDEDQVWNGGIYPNFEITEVSRPNFEVIEVIQVDGIKDGFRSVFQEIFDISSADLAHWSTTAKKTKVEPGDLDLIFKVTEVIKATTWIMASAKYLKKM